MYFGPLTAGTTVHGTAGSRYGPYLRGFPHNPINRMAGVRTVASMPGSPSGIEGWIYDSTTGEFRANVAGAAESGTPLFGL